MGKKEIYLWIKIGGMLSYLPVILVAGPLGGFFVGTYIQKTFNLGWYVSLVTIGIGFIASMIEAIRVIKLVSNIDKRGANGANKPAGTS